MQICDYAEKRRICRENCKYALDKNFHGHFCPRRKAAKFCHPVPNIYCLRSYVCPCMRFVRWNFANNVQLPAKCQSKVAGWVFKKRSLHQIAPLAHTDSSIISPIDKQDNLGGHRCRLRLLGASKTIDFKTEHHADSLFEDGA